MPHVDYLYVITLHCIVVMDAAMAHFMTFLVSPCCMELDGGSTIGAESFNFLLRHYLHLFGRDQEEIELEITRNEAMKDNR